MVTRVKTNTKNTICNWLIEADYRKTIQINKMENGVTPSFFMVSLDIIWY